MQPFANIFHPIKVNGFCLWMIHWNLRGQLAWKLWEKNTSLGQRIVVYFLNSDRKVLIFLGPKLRDSLWMKNHQNTKKCESCSNPIYYDGSTDDMILCTIWFDLKCTLLKKFIEFVQKQNWVYCLFCDIYHIFKCSNIFINHYLKL